MFLIHDTGDPRINSHQPRDLQALAQHTGANLQAWYVDGSYHAQTVFHEPAG